MCSGKPYVSINARTDERRVGYVPSLLAFRKAPLPFRGIYPRSRKKIVSLRLKSLSRSSPMSLSALVVVVVTSPVFAHHTLGLCVLYIIPKGKKILAPYPLSYIYRQMYAYSVHSVANCVYGRNRATAVVVSSSVCKRFYYPITDMRFWEVISSNHVRHLATESTTSAGPIEHATHLS
ncbi:hypothetical protein F4809DRAFT_52077 [Biscogniauxia mediterranea]|nr:hypothetical protein F4809DRAFT_52077 [Biscogniauxia mediterranea]